MPVTLLRQPLSNERNKTAALVTAFLRHFSMEITRTSDTELAEVLARTSGTLDYDLS